MIINLILNEGAGLFQIGENIIPYLKTYPYSFNEAEASENWEEYNFFDESLEVYADKNTKTIESIACRVNCTYNNINLIGNDFTDVLNIFNKTKDELEFEDIYIAEDEIQRVFEIPDYSLQIWVDSNNIIKTIFIG